MKRKFEIFLNSLFQRYKEEEELKEPFASLELPPYRVNKARKTILSQMLWLRHEIKKHENGIGEIGCSFRIFKYYLKFVKNVFDCLMKYKYFQHQLFEAYPIPYKLFHGTTTVFLPGIEKEGLHPCKTGRCWTEDKYKVPSKVCLTDSLYAAEFFALVATQKFGGEPIVLKVNIKGLEDKMRMRYANLVEKGFIVFNRCFEFYLTEPIPSNRIKEWDVLPKPSAYELFTDLIDISNYSEEVKEKRLGAF